MYIEPYAIDNESCMRVKDCEMEIPLACNLIYYVESIENKPLNTAPKVVEEIAEDNRCYADSADVEDVKIRRDNMFLDKSLYFQINNLQPNKKE